MQPIYSHAIAIMMFMAILGQIGAGADGVEGGGLPESNLEDQAASFVEKKSGQQRFYQWAGKRSDDELEENSQGNGLWNRNVRGPQRFYQWAGKRSEGPRFYQWAGKRAPKFYQWAGNHFQRVSIHFENFFFCSIQLISLISK